MTSMKIFLIVLLVKVISNFAEGLECWTCDNQPSIFHCMFIGELKTCESNQMSCKTDVRRCGPKFIVIKGCKQTEACLSNAKSQVTPESSGLTQCNTDQESSICTCCCQGDKCNLNSNPCSGMKFNCDQRVSPPNVDITCTNGSSAGSVCSYQCTEPGFFPYPSSSSQCLNYGEWTQPLPCCARICPRFLRNDVLLMRNANSAQVWEKFLSDIAQFSARYNIGNRSLRPGVLSYGSKVNTGTNHSIFLNETAARNRRAFNAKLSTLQFTNDTGDINTGNALTYALQDYFTIEAGDRIDARNVIVLQIDDVSTDNVTEIAKILRDEGFTIFVIASTTNTDEEYTEQLLDIAGSPGNVLFNDEIAGPGFVAELVASLCRNPCSNELLPLLEALSPGLPVIS